MSRPTCATGKVKYLSVHAAKRALRSRNHRLNGRMHAYWCDACRCWHIGHHYRS